jgi:hypothetical protein
MNQMRYVIAEKFSLIASRFVGASR